VQVAAKNLGIAALDKSEFLKNGIKSLPASIVEFGHSSVLAGNCGEMGDKVCTAFRPLKPRAKINWNDERPPASFLQFGMVERAIVGCS